MKRLMLVFTLFGAVMAAGAALTQPLPAPSVPLFLPAAAADLRAVNPLPEQAGTLRTRLAQFDPAALTQLRGAALTLNLFSDASFTAVGGVQSQNTTRDTGGVTLWTGSVDGEPYSNVVMLTDAQGNVDLRVLLLGRNYFVQSLGGGVARISEIDPSAGRYSRDGQSIDDAVPYTPTEAEQREVMDNRASPRADDGTVIDVMVVYTPAAVALLGGEAQTRLAIEATAALTNATYQNSGVDFRIRLVHVAQVSYLEGSSDLGRLQGSSDGYMDIVHQWRNDYAADLVVLIPGTSVEGRNYCGIANLPLGMPAPGSAFSITEALCISDITFAHELGHNMGKAHDHANAGSAIHAYAYGYQDESTGTGDYGDWVTVMAYSTDGDCPNNYIPGECPAIAYWSDNEATYMGKPLGSPTFQEDNAQSLNETALNVANYRLSGDGGSTVPTAVPTLPPIPTPGGTPVPNRILNGSFEFDNDTNGVPDAWAWTAQAGGRVCGVTGLPDGNCRLNLAAGAAIVQNAAVDGLAGGDQVDLTAMVRTKPGNAAACARIKIKVKYVDPSAGAAGNGKDKFKIPLTAASPNQWLPFSASVTLDDTPKLFSLTLTSSCVKIWWVDDVKLSEN